MTLNIHDRAREIVAQSHGPKTLSEAYSELAKRRRSPRDHSFTDEDRRAFSYIESPRHYAWQDRADLK